MTDENNNLITIDLNDILSEFDGKEYFDDREALAALLMTHQIGFANGNFYVSCNDVFAWGVSDAELMPYSELKNVFKMYLKDPDWGTAMWCAIQIRELPQDAVVKSIRKGGIWDIDAFAKEHSLRPNWYSGYSHTVARHKLEMCNAWRKEQGLEPVEYTASWWKLGWEPYVAANPDWNSPEYIAERDARLEAWKIEREKSPN